MFIRQIEDRLRQPPACSPRSLGPRQCQHLAAVVAELVPDWSVNLRHDILGNATIVILPDDLDDSIGPALFVHGEGSTFHLEELRWGAYRKLDEYRTWDEVLRAVRIRLIWEMPFPTPLTDQRC